MSTAHKPTWAPAMGHAEQGGNRLFFASNSISAKDQPGNNRLKRRHVGQGCLLEQNELMLNNSLIINEANHQSKKARINVIQNKTTVSAEIDKCLPIESVQKSNYIKSRSPIPQRALVTNPLYELSTPKYNDYPSDDEESILLLELNRIKLLRDKNLNNESKTSPTSDTTVEVVAQGNVLRNLAFDDPSKQLDIGRNWDEDVLFKNQSRLKSTLQKKFINDTVRSDHHINFMNRYVK
jgi:protein CWC15